MLIDTHCHLSAYLYKRFGRSITPILKQIEKNKILTISNSLSLTSYKMDMKIAQRSKYVIPSFGIHPQNAYKYIDKTGLIKKLIRKNKIIGEIGLDYFNVRDKGRYLAQKKIFKLFLSKTKDKVISVHAEGAEKDVLNLLKEYENNKVIIHWFSGDFAVLENMIDEGYYFSINPKVKFSNNIKKIVHKIPLKQLLTETDNPIGPKSYMNKIGMPILIRDVINEIAKIKDKNSRQIEKIVQDNFVRLALSTSVINYKKYDLSIFS